MPAPGELFTAGIRTERPSGQWSYSNLGFVALGALGALGALAALAALGADVLGAPFGACLEQWVLEPLGLTKSVSLQQLPTGGTPGGIPVARGHAFDAGLFFPAKPSAVLALGAGDLGASARDVAALAVAVANERLLPPESTREMLAPFVQCGRPGKASECRSSTTARCPWSGTAEPSLGSTRPPTPVRKPRGAPPSSRTPTLAC